MKLPFTWAELSPEDKAWLENVPATAVWEFVEKRLSKLERLPFDDPYHAPSGADFMLKYGDRLRDYVREHENDPHEIDPELDAALNAIDPKLTEAWTDEQRRHADDMRRLYEREKNGEISFEDSAEEFAELEDRHQKLVDEMRKVWAAHPSTAKIQAFQQKGIDEVDAYYKHFAPNGRIDTSEDLLAAKYRALIAQLLEVARNYRTHQRADYEKRQKLEAEVAKLTAERDAALKARDEMLKLYTDQHG